MSPNAGSAVSDVLNSGYIGEGPITAETERSMSEFLGNDVALTHSCTSGLDLVYHVLGLKEGDWVVSTPQTCFATHTTLVNRRVNIAWADIDPLTGLIDPADVSRVVARMRADGTEPKAIVTVDWGGTACDYDELRRNGVPIVQDAAHSIDTRYKGEPISRSGGDFVVWSFQAIKTLTASDGGAVKTRSPEETERVRILRWFGLDRNKNQSFRCRDDIPEAGYKYHMTDVNAAILRENLRILPENLERIRQNSRRLCREIDNPYVTVPEYTDDSSWWLFTVSVRSPYRDGMIAWLSQLGIESSLVHKRNDQYSCFDYLDPRYRRDLPGVQEFDQTHLCVPNGWWLTSEETDHVIGAINRFDPLLG